MIVLKYGPFVVSFNVFSFNNCNVIGTEMMINKWPPPYIYLDTMIQVASSFSTDPSLDVVLSSIPAQIYEAIHLLKENMDTFTAKVCLIVNQGWQTSKD